MIPYILYVTLITTLCFLFYKLLLQKETFYQLNRWMLMGSLAVAFALPLLPAPFVFSTDRSEALPRSEVAAPVEMARVVVPPADILPEVERPAVPVVPVKLARKAERREVRREDMVVSASTPQTAVRPVAASTPAAVQAVSKPVMKSTSLSVSTVLSWLFYVWMAGIVLFGANFLWQLAVLLYQSYANPAIRDGSFRIVELSGNRAPCSFGRTIFINPANYDWDTYNQILIHEKTHVSGRHTVDIILAELAAVLQWFNPIAWLYRREVENNLEFLTDASVLLHADVERSAYQLSLLRVSAPHLSFSLTNNYNQSLLKRRIVMMNSQRSSRRTVWKYFFLLPLFTLLVCLLNKPAAWAQTAKPAKSASKKATKPATAAASATPATSAVPPTSANAAAPAAPATAAEPAEPSTITIHEASVDPEPAITVSTSNGSGWSRGEGSSATPGPLTEVSTTLSPLSPLSTLTRSNVNLTTAVQPVVSVSSNVDVNVYEELTDGSWFVTTHDGKLYFELKAQNDSNSWSNTLAIEKSELTPFPGVGSVEFKLVRDAGTMTFKGQFDGEQGFGHFHFDANDGYFRDLQQLGVEEIGDQRRLSFFRLNIKKDYVKMILDNGYPHISVRYLISFAAMHVDKEFIQYWKGVGIVDIDDPRTLVSLKALHIDRAYVDELKAAGYDHLSSRELMSLKAQHIDGAYAKSMGKDNNGSMVPVRDLVSYKAMNIDPEYVNAMRKVGYPNLERHDITSLYSMHVTAEYVKGFLDMGYKDIAVRDLISLKAQGVTPEFVKSFRDAGMKELSLREFSQLKSMRVDPEFMKGFKDIGYDDISVSRLYTLKSLGITPEYVKEFKKLGFENIPVSMLTSLKSSGVNADYISKMREKGFVSKDLNKYIRLKYDFN